MAACCARPKSWELTVFTGLKWSDYSVVHSFRFPMVADNQALSMCAYEYIIIVTPH